MTRVILHVDMDAFYASVEQRDDPRLRGRPVIVGGPSRRGVVCAASYEVRPFGVRSAMPMTQALRLAPHAVVVPVRMAHYAEVSREVFAIFRRYTPLVEGLSLDEAFLDVGASRALFGDGEACARAIQKDIADELGLPASAGVAPNKFAAKIASDLRKPRGITVVPDDVAGFLAELPVGKMWGIGHKSEARVREAGFRTIGDLARADEGRLEALLGSWGRAVRALANGIDDRAVVPERDAKSIGAEETFETDLRGADALLPRVLGQCDRVAQRLVADGLWASVITLKVKYGDFRSVSRQAGLDEPACDATTLFETARRLFDRVDLRTRGVRLTGVSASGLCESPTRSLFPDPRIERGRKLEDATAKLRARFGDGALRRAALLDVETREERMARGMVGGVETKAPKA